MLIDAATAMQHVCLAKALMLIRESEMYDSALTSREQRASIKVCIHYVTRYRVD